MQADLFETSRWDVDPAVELRAVSKRFLGPGKSFAALRDVDLRVNPGEFCAVVGPTGCGKSTLLNLVAGLESPTTGVVEVYGRILDGIAPETALMLQADAILPFKSVLENVMIGPLVRGARRREAAASARKWLTRVGLADFEDRYPHQLSGGMRKRVALAQTLIVEPAILLMDEPFASLDAQTRQIMSGELLRLWEETRPAVLFVTHDLDEAVALSDRVIVMAGSSGSSGGSGSSVKGSFLVDLPRPRAVPEIRFDGRFVRLRQHIWEALRGELDEPPGRNPGGNRPA